MIQKKIIHQSLRYIQRPSQPSFLSIKSHSTQSTYIYCHQFFFLLNSPINPNIMYLRLHKSRIRWLYTIIWRSSWSWSSSSLWWSCYHSLFVGIINTFFSCNVKKIFEEIKENKITSLKQTASMLWLARAKEVHALIKHVSKVSK